MDIFLALLGFIGLGLIVYLLLKEYTSPALAFISVSLICACILLLMQKLGFNVGESLGVKGGEFNLKILKTLIKDGVKSVSDTAALFVFSILFFSVLNASGFFTRIINFLLSKMSANVYKVTILTVFIASLVHLDGSGAATFLIVVPALLPIYERLNMKASSLLLICAASMGIMNVLPWGGPTLRAASNIQMEANTLYFMLYPIQIIGLILALALAIIIARIEIKRGAGNVNLDNINLSVKESEFENNKFFFANMFILFFVIGLLISGALPSYVCFMVGLCIILPLNYPNLKIAKKVLDSSSSSAIMMYITLLGAGILIGIFEKSGIMNKMGALILNYLPSYMGAYIPMMVGILAVPMAIIFCTDSYFYGVMPIVLSVTKAFGIEPSVIAIIMVVARNCATFISPVVPATLLGCGLANVSIKEHIKTSFFYIWGISIICLVFAKFINII
ncbi:SLC13 family permease [Campylobacter canadensis]|uniref:Citrate transporter n=1 Tax=Campylobacter canadensis TaxID=449520 RepID=A0ABS7WPX4_9BACT|nr:SLC13 family permease [Campylobacter canadensis]MBZ7986807.1 citrate transporter [Campylobacter canadensis]MBZ7995119.1 citrate transporter [Campylobacter canadensis]MBZ7996599.1 citrate transporter [Campylobacter canadensis]MBZ7997844.1 citrate transporter [Campylobacter canadensis]MBZ8000488.1 citrate transporter [Campylobacter canadensis]